MNLQRGASVVRVAVELPAPQVLFSICFAWRFLLKLEADASHRLDIWARRAISERGRFSGWAVDALAARRPADRKSTNFMLIV